MSHPAPKCPFCSGEVAGVNCVSCGANITAPRRACSGCGTLMLASGKTCQQCGTLHRSEMTWKIPLIVAIFVLAIGTSIMIQLFA